MIPVYVVLLSMVAAVQAETKCYENLGCFTNDGPYGDLLLRPLSIFPDSPKTINTRFLLFTVDNTDHYQVVSAYNLSSLRESNYNCSRKTIYIVHGFIEKGTDPWLVGLCRVILQRYDVNCICVDWSGGSYALYTKAANNVQVVGAEIAHFINVTMTNLSCPLDNTILIGHSLGAHAVGEAGKRRPGVPVIFGLLGIDQSVGHKDFNPNGGRNQPGCSILQTTLDLVNYQLSNLSTGALNIFKCSHVASVKLFTESVINPGGFMAYCADDYPSFTAGAGFPCPNGSCTLMGYNTRDEGDATCQNYYLNTGPEHDYERWRYNVTLQITGSAVLGSLQVTLCNPSNCSEDNEIYSGVIAGGTYSKFIDARIPGPVTNVTFIWKILLNLFNQKLGAKSVTVQDGKGTVYKFCGNAITRDGVPQTLHHCP
ncbi:pancreatic triacylglycerol lipase-like isoform X2 [Pseudophryne corroboree]|uniref:pancreatic triacylglycerol lipase-like isoform X2 n=1 Tax=Pseudophryne corroboree TaxID=495146 RepID=UPI003081789A